MEGAVPTPAAVIVHGRAQGGAHALQQRLQDDQGKAAAGLAISGLRKNALGEILETGHGEIAVEDLDNKEVDRGNGIQQPLAKVIADFPAHLKNLASVENLGNLSLNAPQGGVDIFEHP